MNDYVLRTISKESNIRALFALTTNLTREAGQRHQTTGAATHILADSLTGGALLGALLKVRHRMAIKIEGNGPARKSVVESDSYGHVRGYVAVPDLAAQGVTSPSEALGTAGLLTVSKDLKLKELYEGIVHLETSEIDRDLTYYLNQSEQIPSHVSLGVAVDDNHEVKIAGGLLIQSLPPYDESVVDQFADRLQEMPPLIDMLVEGNTPEDIAALLYGDEPYDILESRPLSFRCHCSRERSRKALMLIGADEIQQLLDDMGQAVIDCHFCHDRYVFSADELANLVKELQ
ncbi:MAG: Hsp33 family molecular chaperone HslO [Ardenticatenaceae bacterium]|nr:Hsp33 family molecular chaperone HslO [Ardenticatenaceae bacterium]